MSDSKKWCTHLTRHVNHIRSRRQPPHPLGYRPISAQLARNIQVRYSRTIVMKKISLRKGGRFCKTCYYHERTRFNKIYLSQGESMEVDDQKIRRE